MEREEEIKRTIFKENERVKNIGCVVRIYTGIINNDNEINETSYNLLKSLLFCKFSKFLIVIDKKYDKNNNYANQNKIIVKMIENDFLKQLFSLFIFLLIFISFTLLG